MAQRSTCYGRCPVYYGTWKLINILSLYSLPLCVSVIDSMVLEFDIEGWADHWYDLANDTLWDLKEKSSMIQDFLPELLCGWWWSLRRYEPRNYNHLAGDDEGVRSWWEAWIQFWGVKIIRLHNSFCFDQIPIWYSIHCSHSLIQQVFTEFWLCVRHFIEY